MKIALLIEGQTEKVFVRHLGRFLEPRLSGRMPRLHPILYHGPTPKNDNLRRDVNRLIESGPVYADAVIALTDVYTGRADFKDASDTKRKMREWVGKNDKFFPHAAQHDFEAWLLPFWEDIQKLAGHKMSPPAGAPESVNHNKPPSYRIKESSRPATRGVIT